MKTLVLFQWKCILAISATKSKTPRFRENIESLVTSANNNVEPTFTSEYTNYFSKEMNSSGRSETVFNHKIKYLIFKRSSSKNNEVFHYYLYLIEELLVRCSTEVPSRWP